MTKSLAEVLSELDDPESIQAILDGPDGNPVKDDAEYSSDKSLSSHYDRFLSRRSNRSPTTIAQYRRTIPILIDFANTNGVTTPYGFNTDLVDDYVDLLQRRYDSDATILTYTKNARLWLKWLQERGYFDESVYLVLNKDTLGLSPKARDEAIPEAEAQYIIQALRAKRRGSPLHAVMEVFWNGGPRIGGIHSTDLDTDFFPKKNTLKFRHRPELGTRLKNGSEQDDFPGNGERDITLQDRVVNAVQWYVEVGRPDVVDDYGRFPLFTTSQGRASKSTIRRWVYEATSCRWAPEKRRGPTCDGNCDPDTNVCPLSYYPHAIRRGAIVNHLSNGLRPDRASDRFNVGVETIRRHYDPRSNDRRREDRLEAVQQAWSSW